MVVWKNREVDYNYLKTQLHQYKNIRVKINDMLKKRDLIRVKKGLYVLSKKLHTDPICLEVLANLIYGPSYVSLEYALNFWGIIPERVDIITSITNKRNKEFKTPVGHFTYRYINQQLYPHEVILHEIDENHNILIANKEKALVDKLYFENELDSVASMRTFLFDNMRCDEDIVAKFRITVVRKLARLYGGNSLLLQQMLEEMK